MRSIALLVFLATACSDAGAQPGGPRPDGPPLHMHPEGAIAIACTVRAEIAATVAADRVRLRVSLVNLGAEEASVTLRVPCPGAPFSISGLPAGFDPLHTCKQGACVAGSSTVTYTIPGGRKSVVLGETVLKAKGDACNKPLPLGSTFFHAEIATEPKQWDVCGGGQVHVVRDHRSGALRKASLLDPPVPAVRPAPAPRPKVTPAPRPKVTPAPRPKVRPSCPTCAFGCLRGVPSTRKDANGCTICGCDSPF